MRTVQWSTTELGAAAAVVMVPAGTPHRPSPEHEADDGQQQPGHVVERVDGDGGAGHDGDEGHQEDEGQDPPVPWRRGRWFAGQRGQVVEQAVEVAACGGRHGGVEPALELGLVEAPLCVVAGQLVGHRVALVVRRPHGGVGDR